MSLSSRVAGASVILTLPVHDWPFIDATVNNTVAIAAQNGDESTAEQGLAVRETGWAAARRHPRVTQGWAGWPPEDDVLTVDLPAESWRFVIGQLRRWDQVDALVSPREEGDQESRFESISRMLEDRLR